VRESLELASLLAALEHDVPTAEVTTVLMAFRPAIADIVMPSLAALAAERRLPVPSGGALADAPVLALTPPGFDPPADAARRYRTESPGERPSIARERRLVYVTFGSEAGRAGFFPWFYRAAIDGLTGRGWQVLLTIGRDADATALGTLPDDVRVERWVDQTSVLRQSAAVVFHGGYGTLIDVLAAGVPAVVLPLFSADQRANAARLAELGSGIALAGPGGMSELAAAVDRLLTDAHHGAAAGRLGDEVASLEGVSTAVGFLESLVP
jgi:UDP:flavonoid glycosyltransferase YjiC (YdhE family)